MKDESLIIKHNAIDLEVIKCLDEDKDLWLIDNTYEDDEGFLKHSYYTARRVGKWQDWETVKSVGSSYTSLTKILEELKGV